MRNIWKKIIALLLCVFCLPFTLVGCKDEETEIVYDFDKSGFYGLCEVFGDMGGGVDPGITNEWIADMAGGLGVKSFRMWISYGELYSVDENDEIIANQVIFQFRGEKEKSCRKQWIFSSGGGDLPRLLCLQYGTAWCIR